MQMFEALKMHLHDVLHKWCPTGQLVGLLAHTLLPVHLLSSAEGGLTEETWRCGGEGVKRTKKKVIAVSYTSLSDQEKVTQCQPMSILHL